MFPVDTVKTRIQASAEQVSVLETVKATWREGGALGFMRGSVVCGVGCVPAHIGLFGTYELAKAGLLDQDGQEHQPLRAAACGALATVAHDSIITPTDVVKQRLQMGGYRGALECVRATWRYEGIHAFYRSLPTTLAMNIPYMGLLVATNESLKRFLNLTGGNSKGAQHFSGAPLYFLSAGISGAFASTLTLPLDVVKTRLQTQAGARYDGIASTMRVIAKDEGPRGFFRGLGPRVAKEMPSAAICWGTYESMRMLLRHLTVGSRSGPSGCIQTEREAGCRVGESGNTATVSAESLESLEWEEWDGSTPFWQHAVAGSCAGMMEHVAMYPIDTVKTRMQAAPVALNEVPPGVVSTVRTVLHEHGVSGLMRGCFAIGTGCIPAHIGLFCTYEWAKARLMDLDNVEHQPLRAASCGAMATVVHDMIITPTDVVKQRLQLGRYRGTLDCMYSVWRHEGLLAFYRSLPTTLISECPFHGVLVASNESLKVLLGLEARGSAAEPDCGVTRKALGWHFFSTGVSGMVAAVVTQPLDVVKTRLQTQNVFTAAEAEEVRVRYDGLMSTALTITREEGISGLFRGTVPRLLFAAPSAAMCWGTFEVMKVILRGSAQGVV